MQRVVSKPNGIVIKLVDNVGYEIRHKDYQGACFTIGFNGELGIGQSGHFHYDYNTWQVITNEIIEGYRFMSKYITMGKSVFNVEATQYIKPKNYVRPAIYLDENGRAIFYLGEALVSNVTQRVDCHIVYWVINNGSNIKSCSMINDTTVGIDISDITSWCFFDYYRGKPRKLVRCLNQFPQSVNKIIIYKDCKFVADFDVQWR